LGGQLGAYLLQVISGSRSCSAVAWKTTPIYFDALYLDDKPTRDNCPQHVYDALVDALERVSEFEGYTFESSSGSARVLFRQVSH
jgi:hypothetical protein